MLFYESANKLGITNRLNIPCSCVSGFAQQLAGCVRIEVIGNALLSASPLQPRLRLQHQPFENVAHRFGRALTNLRGGGDIDLAVTPQIKQQQQIVEVKYPAVPMTFGNETG